MWIKPLWPEARRYRTVRKMSRKGVLLIVLLVALLIGGFVYFNRPTRVVEGAVTKFGQAKTAHFTANVELQNVAAAQPALGDNSTVDVAIDGAFNREQPGPAAIGTKVTIATKADNVSISLDGEVRFIGDKVYVFITKAPNIYALFQQLKGQWLEFNRGSAPANATSAPVPAHLFTKVERQGTEEIDNVKAVKYQATTSAEGFVHMMDSLAQMLGTQLTSDQIKSLQDSIPNNGTVPVTIWVKQWSHDLKQIQTSLTVPAGNSVKFTLTLHDTNQPVKIDTPSGAKPVEDVVKAALKATNPSPTATAVPTASAAPK